ncbi:DUF3800 domain-containing protein [Polaromonas sp. P2-4]|nr:DUF3800 domain-containing protein [Polaromonas sp. P2-4]
MGITELQKELHFYVDDSGSRDPDRKPTSSQHEPNWFALGGVLVDPSDKERIDARITGFRSQWPQIENRPFRSYDIRHKTDRFAWLNSLSQAQQACFFDGLTELMLELPITALACVIDRPGYNQRYMNEYGQRRWKLCKTAFNIAVERAAKFAVHHEARLRVFVERSDKPTETQFKQYFNEMRNTGQPFDAIRSAKYKPLSANVLHKTLFEFRIKTKESYVMQLADLMLWPMCKGGYSADDRVYKLLVENGKLLDAHCTVENGLEGIKYSCFPSPT